MALSDEEIRGLSARVESNTEAMKAVGDEVRRTREQNTINERVLRSVSATSRWSAFGVAVLVIGSLAIGAVAVQSNHAARDARRSVAAIADCTTPAGQCAQRGARQSQAAIAGVELRRNQTEQEYAEWRTQHPEDPFGVEFRRQKIVSLQAEIDRLRKS